MNVAIIFNGLRSADMTRCMTKSYHKICQNDDF